MDDYGAKMKAERLKRNLPLETVADDLGITVRSYRAYEAGSRRPRVETMAKIAEYFGVPVTDLFF